MGKTFICEGCKQVKEWDDLELKCPVCDCLSCTSCVSNSNETPCCQTKWDDLDIYYGTSRFTGI